LFCGFVLILFITLFFLEINFFFEMFGANNPKCAECGKNVYPMEKMNALDVSWHKGCFQMRSL